MENSETRSRSGLRPLLIAGLAVGVVVGVGHGYMVTTRVIADRWHEYESKLIAERVTEKLSQIAVDVKGEKKIATDLTREDLERVFFLCQERGEKLEVKMQMARDSLTDSEPGA